MANESLWVRSNLDGYCGPGEHRFITAWHGAGGVRWCSDCYKEEPIDGSGCLICDLPGAHDAELSNLRGESSPVRGRICDPCRAGFAEREVIGGWVASLSRGGSARPAAPGDYARRRAG